MKKLHFDTLQVHAGHEPDSTGSRAVPIYQTTAYLFKNAQHGADLFSLKESGNIYTRMNNPTTEVFEKRMAALENGVAAVATSSGQTAEFISITNLASAGDNIVSHPYLYGGTYNLFKVSLARLGIEVRFADGDNVSNIASLIDNNTKPSISDDRKSRIQHPDVEAIVALARKHEIAVIMDNTFGQGGFI